MRLRNKDEKINIADLVLLQNYLLHNSTIDYEADMNKDGRINVFDLISIKKYITKNIEEWYDKKAIRKTFLIAFYTIFKEKKFINVCANDVDLDTDEEKEALSEFGSTDSGASLGDILGAAIAKKEAEKK